MNRKLFATVIAGVAVVVGIGIGVSSLVGRGLKRMQDARSETQCKEDKEPETLKPTRCSAPFWCARERVFESFYDRLLGIVLTFLAVYTVPVVWVIVAGPEKYTEILDSKEGILLFTLGFGVALIALTAASTLVVLHVVPLIVAAVMCRRPVHAHECNFPVNKGYDAGIGCQVTRRSGDLR